MNIANQVECSKQKCVEKMEQLLEIFNKRRIQQLYYIRRLGYKRKLENIENETIKQIGKREIENLKNLCKNINE